MATFLKNTALALSAAGMVAASVPAFAAVPMHSSQVSAYAGYGDHDWDDDDDQGGRWEHHRHDHGRHNGWNRGGGYDQRYYGQGSYGGYDQRVAYNEPVYDNTRIWRNNGQNYCQHRDGTTGLLIGGAAGALLGREVAGRYGDRTLGAILGAVGGALVGRQIDKNHARCR